MYTVLITGGAGYIGSHAAKAFYEKDYKVIVLDNLSRGHRDFARWGDFFEGDIGDKNILEKIFEKYKIDVISHFAALSLVGESVTAPKPYYENNILKAINLINMAVLKGVNVFQFSSSCAVYGKAKQDKILENQEKKPINPYGTTKLFFENILKDYERAYGLKYSILRYFNAAGASTDCEIGEDHTPETHLIPIVLDVALGKRETFEIYGDGFNTPDGTCIRDYIHVSDLANAHVLAAEKSLKNNVNTVYNLGNETGYSVKEIVKATSEIVGKKISYILAPPRVGDPGKLVSLSEKIQKELNFKSKHNLESIINTAWKWHKKRFKLKSCNWKGEKTFKKNS